jgi:hypothetical protein
MMRNLSSAPSYGNKHRATPSGHCAEGGGRSLGFHPTGWRKVKTACKSVHTAKFRLTPSVGTSASPEAGG